MRIEWLLPAVLVLIGLALAGVLLSRLGRRNDHEGGDESTEVDSSTTSSS